MHHLANSSIAPVRQTCPRLLEESKSLHQERLEGFAAVVSTRLFNAQHKAKASAKFLDCLASASARGLADIDNDRSLPLPQSHSKVQMDLTPSICRYQLPSWRLNHERCWRHTGRCAIGLNATKAWRLSSWAQLMREHLRTSVNVRRGLSLHTRDFHRSKTESDVFTTY